MNLYFLSEITPIHGRALEVLKNHVTLVSGQGEDGLMSGLSNLRG